MSDAEGPGGNLGAGARGAGGAGSGGPARGRSAAGRRCRPTLVPAPALFMASGISLYLGAALAVSLFSVLPAAHVAWWRITVAAVFLLLWRRPWRRAWTGAPPPGRPCSASCSGA